MTKGKIILILCLIAITFSLSEKALSLYGQETYPRVLCEETRIVRIWIKEYNLVNAHVIMFIVNLAQITGVASLWYLANKLFKKYSMHRNIIFIFAASILISMIIAWVMITWNNLMMIEYARSVYA